MANPIGRPSKYSPHYCDEVVSFMGEGYSLTAFAGEIGVARSTINEWINQFPEFSEACKKGQAKRTRHLETGLLNGEIGPAITARIFALKNAAPEEWREKVEQHHTGSVKVERIESVIIDPVTGQPDGK